VKRKKKKDGGGATRLTWLILGIAVLFHDEEGKKPQKERKETALLPAAPALRIFAPCYLG